MSIAADNRAQMFEESFFRDFAIAHVVSEHLCVCLLLSSARITNSAHIFISVVHMYIHVSVFFSSYKKSV